MFGDEFELKNSRCHPDWQKSIMQSFLPIFDNSFNAGVRGRFIIPTHRCLPPLLLSKVRFQSRRTIPVGNGGILLLIKVVIYIRLFCLFD